MSSSTAVAATCTVNDNVLSTGFSCTIGGLTFSNFMSNTNESNPPGIDIQAVGSDGFTLNPNLPTNGTPQMSDIWVQFKVAGGVSGVGLSVNGDPAKSSVNENVCATQQGLIPGMNLGICSQGNLLAFLSVAGGGSASASFTSTNPIWIFKDINANGSSISEVNQVYTSSTVPEPMTLSMMGVGLLGLGLISRRRKKS